MEYIRRITVVKLDVLQKDLEFLTKELERLESLKGLAGTFTYAETLSNLRVVQQQIRILEVLKN